jgi:hypothetical protein
MSLGADRAIGASINPYTGDRESGALNAYDAERNRIEAENPQVGDYTEYRAYYRQKSPQEIRQFRKDALSVGDDTEFAIAHDDFRDYLVSQGTTGEELELALDKWTTSEAGYMAMMGLQYKSDREPGRAIFNAVDTPPWREPLDEAQSKGEDKETETRERSALPGALEDAGDYATYRTREEYKDYRYPYRRPKKTSSSSGGYGNLVQEYLIRK